MLCDRCGLPGVKHKVVDFDTGSACHPFLWQCIDEQRLVLDSIGVLADELVQAQNQMHGIRGCAMAKGTVKDVELELRKISGKGKP